MGIIISRSGAALNFLLARSLALSLHHRSAERVSPLLRDDGQTTDCGESACGPAAPDKSLNAIVASESQRAGEREGPKVFLLL